MLKCWTVVNWLDGGKSADVEVTFGLYIKMHPHYLMNLF